MANVLPIEAQKKLWGIQRARFIAVGSLVALVLAGVAGLSLLPSFVALELYTYSPDQSAANSTAAEGLKNLMRAQAQIDVIRPIVGATSSPMGAIEHALSIRPKGVTVDSFRYNGGSPKQIILRGKASRDGLTAYRNALEESGRYAGVAVPVGALFTESGRFTLTLTGAF
jgi:hypothetical protein